MNKGLKRAVGLPLAWGFIWAIPGFGIEALSNLGVAIGQGVDMWPQTLGIPGLVAGVLFTVLVAATGRLGSFEGSLPLVLGLGALVGVAMGGIVASGVVGGEDSAATYVFVLVMSVTAAFGTAIGLRLAARRAQATAAPTA